jgi:O-antigen ligase
MARRHSSDRGAQVPGRVRRRTKLKGAPGDLSGAAATDDAAEPPLTVPTRRLERPSELGVVSIQPSPSGPQTVPSVDDGHGFLPRNGPFADWCGWVVVGVLALTPLLAWLGCLGFAPLVAVAGLMTLPAMRWPQLTQNTFLSLGLLLTWICVSALWSPYFPPHPWSAEAPKLFVLFLTGTALLGAVTRSSLRPSRVAETLLIYGMLLLAVVLFFEGLTQASLYSALRAALGTKVRPDLAAKDVAQGLYVLILLGPAAAVSAHRRTGKLWPAWLMAAGLVVPGIAWSYDAPLLALMVAGLSGLAAYRFPRAAPMALAGLAGVFFLGAPWVIQAARTYGLYDYVFARVEPSWSERMGYWRVAATATKAHPFRGWGLDASRMFSPGIHLHPHDSAIQVWLELGLPGALLAALVFGALFWRLRRPWPDTDAAVAVATTTGYLTIGAVSFGVWQEWWVALGVVAAMACLLVSQRQAWAMKIESAL